MISLLLRMRSVVMLAPFLQIVTFINLFKGDGIYRKKTLAIWRRIISHLRESTDKTTFNLINCASAVLQMKWIDLKKIKTKKNYAKLEQ